MAMDYGGVDNILNICSLNALNILRGGIKTIKESLVWIWEISWEKLMEWILNGEIKTQGPIGKELQKYVLRRFLKFVHIGWYLLAVLIINLISKILQNHLFSFQFQTNSFIQDIFILGHGPFHLGKYFHTNNLRRKCSIHKPLLEQREFHI